MDEKEGDVTASHDQHQLKKEEKKRTNNEEEDKLKKKTSEVSFVFTHLMISAV